MAAVLAEEDPAEAAEADRTAVPEASEVPEDPTEDSEGLTEAGEDPLPLITIGGREDIGAAAR